MSLINKNKNPDDEDNENNPNENGVDSNDMDQSLDENGMTKAGSLLFDFSNNNEMLMNGTNGAMRKKRKPNPEKDKYIQEPQYVTKRTSSGRVVRMKVINDFDYTSDQEDGATKKRKRDEGEDREGIQQRHRKNGMEDDEFMQSSNETDDSVSHSSSEEDNSNDEDFGVRNGGSRKPHKRNHHKSHSGPGRPPLNGGQPRQRKTIKQLTESMRDNNVFPGDSDDDHKFDNDSDNDLNLSNFTKKYNNSMLNKNTPILATVTENTTTTLSGTPKLTFEQYVKKLTGSSTIGQILNENKNTSSSNPTTQSQIVKINNNTTTSVSNNQSISTPTRFSLKITPAPSINSQNNATTSSTTGNKLTIPTINPAIKAVLNKIPSNTTQTIVNSQPESNQNINTSTTNNAVKIITVNSPLTNSTNSSTTNVQNKKFVILNSAGSITTTTTTTAGTFNTSSSTTPIKTSLTPVNSSIKIINISSNTTTTTTSTPTNILTPINSNKPHYIMINANNILNSASKPQNQIIQAIPITQISTANGATTIQIPSSNVLSSNSTVIASDQINVNPAPSTTPTTTTTTASTSV